MSAIVQISWSKLSCIIFVATCWVCIDVVNATMIVFIEEVVALTNYGIHCIQYRSKNTWNYLETRHFNIWKLSAKLYNRTPVITISKSCSRNRILKTGTKWFPDVNRNRHHNMPRNAQMMKSFQTWIGYR